MTFNKEEARRAMDAAEKKLSENDYNGAKKFLYKAQDLYPKVDGLNHMLTMIDVYISAANKINGETDWYGILCVDPLADDEAVKKQYKKLALLLHPDKNRFTGAEGAFKLISQAWDLLSNTAQRILYDHKRKKQVKRNKNGSPKPHEYKYESEPDHEHEPESEPYHEHWHDSSWKQKKSWKPEKVIFFWTMCNRCNVYCQYVRASNLNKTRSCPNCGQDFIATEIVPEVMIDGRTVIRFSTNYQSTNRSPSDASSSTTSASDNTTQGQEKESQENIVVSVAAKRNAKRSIDMFQEEDSS